ncbi:MAG TPA: serine/threonine-protein kinase, partial [Isosphaeraceae bacterium]
PARAFLSGSDLVRASVWIVARLAEGLEHAHSRGLLHRDLKPSNVLIAADGTPMLLDFNLAAESLGEAPDDGARAMMGGTLPYMAPEHLDAFNPRGSTPPGAVDERSDLYALGLILFAMIAARPAFPEAPAGLELIDLLAWLTAQRREGAPSLRAAEPRVSPGLDAIVSKCLDPEPDRRYRSAGELAEDLRRFLDDLPLKFAPEPSARERLTKWARRHPRASSIWTIAPLAAALILTIGAVAWTKADHLREVAARLNLRRFREAFHECQFLLNTSGSGGLDDHLRRGVEQAHALIDRFGVGRRGDWSRGYWVAPLTPEEQTALRRDLGELILLEARARVRLSQSEGTEDDRRRALEWAVAWLDRAEALDPSPSPALFAERARYHHALGQAGQARRDRARAEAAPAVTYRDEYLLGTAELADGHPDRAERRLRRAVTLDPKRFWAWFALGLCHFDQGRYADAVGDFNVCTVLMPEFAWPFANRGLSLARAGRLPEAIDSFDRALSLSPTFA